MVTVYYQNFQGAESLARCPWCGHHIYLTPIEPQSDELGVTWFRCQCGKTFKAPGLWQPVRREPWLYMSPRGPREKK